MVSAVPCAPRARRSMLLGVAVAVAAGVLAGLARLGWNVPFGGTHAMEHGPLLVLGAFGTVIALERAVALGPRWAYVAPTLGTAAAAALLLGWWRLGGLLAAAAASWLCAINVAICRRQSAPFTWLMLLGSGVLVTGTVAWVSDWPLFRVVPTWLTFFVLTIVAERLEMSRLAPTPGWAAGFLGMLCVAAAVCALAAIASGDLPIRLLGALFVLVACWQLRFDLARRTIAQPGLPRFAALGVLLGAVWLGVGGLVLALTGLPPAGPAYDAVLHAIFVGFVLSMVFAHAPIILPAVARIDIPFHPALYVPLAVLHVTVAARVIGDLAGVMSLRRGGGLGNAVALVLFLVAVLAARAPRAHAAAGDPRVPPPDV